MWRWPRITPGSVSTSRSRMVSRCFCAKWRTWLCANLMSSRSRLPTWPIALSISASVRRKLFGSQLSNFFDSSRIAASPRASTSARMVSTVSRTLAWAALIAVASIPRLRWRAMGYLLRLLRVLPRSLKAWTPGTSPGDAPRSMRREIRIGAGAPSRTTATRSFDRLRVDRRAGGARDDQRRPAEEELVDAVVRAVLGEFLEIEDLAHAQAHRRDHHPVPRLVRLGGLVGADLDAPSVRADRGDLLVVAPVAVLELDAGRIAARVTAPGPLLEATLHL